MHPVHPVTQTTARAKLRLIDFWGALKGQEWALVDSGHDDREIFSCLARELQIVKMQTA